MSDARLGISGGSTQQSGYHSVDAVLSAAHLALLQVPPLAVAHGDLVLSGDPRFPVHILVPVNGLHIWTDGPISRTASWRNVTT
jgi:hypothetical protein